VEFYADLFDWTIDVRGYRLRRALAVFYSCFGFRPPIIHWALPAVAVIVNGSVAEGRPGKPGRIDHVPLFPGLLGVEGKQRRL